MPPATTAFRIAKERRDIEEKLLRGGRDGYGLDSSKRCPAVGAEEAVAWVALLARRASANRGAHRALLLALASTLIAGEAID
jgi:hypothetical protein